MDAQMRDNLIEDIKAEIQQMIREFGLSVKRGKSEVMLKHMLDIYLLSCEYASKETL